MAYTTTDGHKSGRSAFRTNWEDGTLQGMKEICAYVGKAEKTVLKYIRDEGLPASKIGGEWVSDREAVDRWRRRRINPD
jgi:excisionase family DNA binding protein